jgi:hypothetical protein
MVRPIGGLFQIFRKPDVTIQPQRSEWDARPHNIASTGDRLTFVSQPA